MEPQSGSGAVSDDYSEHRQQDDTHADTATTRSLFWLSVPPPACASPKSMANSKGTRQVWPEYRRMRIRRQVQSTRLG